MCCRGSTSGRSRSCRRTPYAAEGGTIRGELVIAEHMTMTSPRLGSRVLLVDDMVDSGPHARGRGKGAARCAGRSSRRARPRCCGGRRARRPRPTSSSSTCPTIRGSTSRSRSTTRCGRRDWQGAARRLARRHLGRTRMPIEPAARSASTYASWVLSGVALVLVLGVAPLPATARRSAGLRARPPARADHQQVVLRPARQARRRPPGVGAWW